MKLKFALNTADHQKTKKKILEISDKSEISKTDRGFKGILEIKDSGIKEIAESLESTGTKSIILVNVNENATADGYAYNVGDDAELSRNSPDNNPETWHGIVYDGMKVDAENMEKL